MDGAVRFMEDCCSRRRDVRLWVAHLEKGVGRKIIADIWKRITKQQGKYGIYAYSVTVFEPDTAGLHAHIVFIGSDKIEAHLRGSAVFAEIFGAPKTIRPVHDQHGLTRGYLAKTRTPQAGYRRQHMLGGRLRGSHQLDGGGDRVRLSRELERDFTEAAFVAPWVHTNARRSTLRKAYRPRRLKRSALKLAGQLPLLPEIERLPWRVRQYGGGPMPKAVALEVEYRRKRLGLTQSQLGGAIGVRQSQLANVLRGHDPLSRFATNRLREVLLYAPEQLL